MKRRLRNFYRARNTRRLVTFILIVILLLFAAGIYAVGFSVNNLSGI